MSLGQIIKTVLLASLFLTLSFLFSQFFCTFTGKLSLTQLSGGSISPVVSIHVEHVDLQQSSDNNVHHQQVKKDAEMKKPDCPQVSVPKPVNPEIQDTKRDVEKELKVLMKTTPPSPHQIQQNSKNNAQNDADDRPKLPPPCDSQLQIENYRKSLNEPYFLPDNVNEKRDILPHFFRSRHEWNDCSENGCWQKQIIRPDSLSLPCMAEAIAEDETLPKDAPFFTHVINPFPNKGGDPQYNWTLRAISEAADYAKSKGIHVEVLAVHFQHEPMEFTDDITGMAILCTWRQGHCVVRKRWGGLADDEVPVRAAVVGDVWTAGYTFGSGKYLVMTNYDIIVRKDFYVKMAQKLTKEPKLKVLDNLRIDLQVAVHGKISHWTVGDIFNWNKTHDHPGHDCFIVPRTWIKCVNFADFVFGIGNWGMTVIRELRHLTELIGAETQVETFGVTRHLGHRTLKGEKWMGSGKDWKESHDQQARHNYWQFAKVVHRIKHEETRANQHMKMGRFFNFSTITEKKWQQQVPEMKTKFVEEQLICDPYLTRTFVSDRSTLNHELPPMLWVATPQMALTIRRILEYSSGFHTGSAYRDVNILNEIPGERQCDSSTLCIYVSPEYHTYKETFEFPFTGHCHKCKQLDTRKAFQNAIIVVEEPLNAIWRLYETHMQRLTGASEPGLTFEQFNEADFAAAGEELAKVLRQEMRQFSRFVRETSDKNNIVILKESDLNDEETQVEAVAKVLNFLGIKADETQIRCALQLSQETLRVKNVRDYLLATPEITGNLPDWDIFSQVHQRVNRRVHAVEAFWEHASACELLAILRRELIYFDIPLQDMAGKKC